MKLSKPWVARFEDEAEEFWYPYGWWQVGSWVSGFYRWTTQDDKIRTRREARLIEAAPEMLERLIECNMAWSLFDDHIQPKSFESYM